MIRKLTLSALSALALTSGVALAAGSGEQHIESVDFSFEGPFGKFDQYQLQRGLQVYTEVCSACHGLKYVPLRTLEDLGYSDAEVRAYSAQYEVYDAELDDMRPAEPTDNFPASSLDNAPDLSLMAKARAGYHGPYGLGLNQLFRGMGGPEYIVSVLTGYTGHEKEEAGAVLHENTAFPGGWIAMGAPLSDGQVEYSDGHENSVHHMAEDVAAFLMWAAEPQMMARKHAGFTAVFFMVLMSVLLYLT
ncbi:MAG: cytochrome c1, partial [Paracoccaceae bacterium]|nr:cytochrome c1 [Paracoccaceae bacterium]